jgi:hypothetical protein
MDTVRKELSWYRKEIWQQNQVYQNGNIIIHKNPKLRVGIINTLTRIEGGRGSGCGKYRISSTRDNEISSGIQTKEKLSIPDTRNKKQPDPNTRSA